MSATQSEALELRPNGGLQVRNSRGELVFWFNKKDPEEEPSFAICYFAPENADTPEKEEIVRKTFVVMREWARRAGMIIFDARDLEREIRRSMREAGQTSRAGVGRTEDITVSCRDMVTGRRAKLTLGVRRTGKNELTVLPPKCSTGGKQVDSFRIGVSR